MEHPNIVELYEYVETPKEYIMYMELADQGDYLSKKILDVCFNFKILINSFIRNCLQ